MCSDRYTGPGRVWGITLGSNWSWKGVGITLDNKLVLKGCEFTLDSILLRQVKPSAGVYQAWQVESATGLGGCVWKDIQAWKSWEYLGLIQHGHDQLLVCG